MRRNWHNLRAHGVIQPNTALPARTAVSRQNGAGAIAGQIVRGSVGRMMVDQVTWHGAPKQMNGRGEMEPECIVGEVDRTISHCIGDAVQRSIWCWCRDTDIVHPRQELEGHGPPA